MLHLEIPALLQREFATVQALWQSTAQTRRVDSLLLSWVKYEKQLRRLFCFLVYQHPRITAKDISAVVETLAQNRELYPSTFIEGIRRLGVKPVSTLIGEQHAELNTHITRIKKYRNKLMHGQITGLAIKSEQLERDVKWLVEWITLLAVGAQTEFGYDGLARNTFKNAKSAARVAVSNYPFADATEFRTWLRSLNGN
jgi:hypothetical protein